MSEKIKVLFNLRNVLSQELVNYIIIYLRKSRKDLEFAKEESIEKTLERHEKILQDWALEVFGCKIPESNIYREVVSGDTIADRPQMQKVLDLIESDNIKGVLCVEIERLARGNSIDQGVIAQKFQLTKTRILTPNKIYDLDDEFDLSFFEDGLYQSRKFLMYTKKILKRGREQSAKEGKFVNSHANFGYKKEKLKQEKGFVLVKDENAQYVRKIFDLYLYDDLGMTNTAKKLNILGIPSPTGQKWTTAMVRSILKRSEVYAGYITWNKRKEVKKYVDGKLIHSKPLNDNYIRVRGRHKPIITEEELELVNKKMRVSSIKCVKNDFELKNPLAGLIKCQFCGKNMVRRNYSQSFVKSGKIHKDTLLCNSIGCQNVSSDLDIVEEKILENIKEKLEDFKTNVDYLEEKQNKRDTLKEEINALNKQLDNLNIQKDKCCELLEKGIYDEETFFKRINSINTEIEKVNISINDCNSKLSTKQKEYAFAIPKMVNLLNLYSKSTIEEKNLLLKEIIDTIYYKKTNKGGRWNNKAKFDFSLDIRYKF